MKIQSLSSPLSQHRKILIAIAALFVLYMLFGFLAFPYMVKRLVLSNITKNLGRNAGVVQIRANPFTLSLTARGFGIYDLDGERFGGFEELYVNFQLSSVFRRAYTFDEIRLVAPDAHIKVFPDGQLNFSDLFPASDQPEPESHAESQLPQVLVFHLSIERGNLAFTDLSRPTPFETDFFPIKIELDEFSTKRDSESPYAFAASMGKGRNLEWEGSFSVVPLRSEGRFKLTNIRGRNLWEYFQHRVNFELTEGSIDFGGQYTARLSGETSRLKLDNCGLTLRNFKVAEKGSADAVLSLPTTAIMGVGVDFAEKRATLTSVRSSDARLAMRLLPDGTLNYLKLFGTVGAREEDGVPKRQEHGTDGDWLVHVDKTIIENYGLTFEDMRLEEPVRISLESINANISNLTNRGKMPAEFTLDIKINESGSLSANGSAGAFPPFADFVVDVSHIAIRPFNSYVHPIAELDIMAGEIGLDGRLRYDNSGEKEPRISYKGDITIDSFEAVSRLYSDDFLNWQALTLRDASFETIPRSLKISEVVCKEPAGRVVIWPDGTVNLNKMLRRDAGEQTDGASTEKSAAMPVAIDVVRIENGTASFSDLLIKPNFLTGIYGVQGTIKGLSSESLARADVSLEGKVDEYAPVKIVGQINPLSEDVYTDLEMHFKNIEMTAFTPYSGRFAGYAIEKGKLSLGLKYKISENVLIGENNIVLDQLTLGERVESPDATKLPVGLALALLRDRNGVINIDLPVKGDLNDPEFSYGHLIFKAFLNLITKTVASPFSMLGGLIGGGGEELSFVKFDFGSSELKSEETGKLDKLARALSERPMLRLEIKGAADTEYDRLALEEAKLLDQLKLAKANESRSRRDKATVLSEEVELSDEDYERLLLDAYVETFEEDPQTLLDAEPETTSAEAAQNSGADQAPSEPFKKSGESGFRVLRVGQQLVETVQNVIRYGPGGPSAREKVIEAVNQSPDEFAVIVQRAKRRLAENIPVEEIELRQLAQMRANHIKGYLIETGEVPNEGIFLVDPEIGRISGDGTLRVDLSLSGR